MIISSLGTYGTNMTQNNHLFFYATSVSFPFSMKQKYLRKTGMP